MKTKRKFEVLGERNYRLFVIGFGISYTLYWITLLAVGWWVWEITGSAAWVGFVFFCDLFPAVLVTPWASALADRGDRFKFLKTILWIQVGTGLALTGMALTGNLTPPIVAAFVFLEGALIGFSQPAFFGLINRLVSPPNLSAAVALNVSVSQTTYILGPLLAGFLFSYGIEIAPLAFVANAIGTLVYLAALHNIELHPEPIREHQKTSTFRSDVLDGLNIFWTNRIVFRAVVLILGVAILQRPLISLMPAINNVFDLFSPAYFTLLTACFMSGSVVAGLIHASNNSDVGLEVRTTKCLAALVVLYCVFFLCQNWFLDGRLFSSFMLFFIGLGSGYVWTGNSVILQNRTPEHLRSRVLGNNFMMTRAIGALSVVLTGFIVEAAGFAMGMTMVASIVAITVPMSLRLGRLYGH